MSSSDQNKPTSPHACSEEVNPFVSFRRFADQQMSSLLHSLVGLPSAFGGNNSTASRSLAYDEDVWLQEARNLRHYLTRESEQIERIMNFYKRAYDKESQENDEEASSLRCPYRPFNSELPKDEQMQASEMRPSLVGTNFVATHLLRAIGAKALADEQHQVARIWPLAYIASSPYSPLQLEQAPPLSEQGNKWRNAFEDLIAIKNGKPMVEEEARENHGSGTAWITSMFERGIFGSGWKEKNITFKQEFPASTENSEAKANANEDNFIELDLYECFLKTLNSPTNPQSSAFAPPTPNHQTLSSTLPNPTKPSLISTLTTTERNTLPDGSVQTKVVLKKRFADGREESTETVHTTYDSQQPQSSSKAIAAAAASNSVGAVEGSPSDSANIKSKEGQKKGWFWS